MFRLPFRPLSQKITILFFSFCTQAISQPPSFKQISCPEKRWVIFHPFVAKKAYRISIEARSISKQMESDSLLDKDADGGQVDAFRHAFWMGRLAQKMNWRKVNRLGKAHERGNFLDFKKQRTGEETFSDSIAGAMDLFNNNIGIDAGKYNKSLSAEEMKIISKDEHGTSLDCEKHPVDLKFYKGKWIIPRCLVNSDEVIK